VFLAKRIGTSWEPYDEKSWLVAQSITETVFPKYATADVILDLAALGAWPWDWKQYLAPDDRILITIYSPDGVEDVLFEGFVCDVDWNFSPGGTDVKVTCCANAFRLLRDVIVHGRHVLCHDGASRLCTALPTHFNHGGRPDKSGEVVTVPGYYSQRGEGGKVPCFIGEDAAGAEYWTVLDALEYLMAFYNAAQAWIDNAVLTTEDSAEDIVEIDVTGMDLLSALAAVADRGGYDILERFSTGIDVSQSPVNRSSMVLFSRFAGDGRTAGDLKKLKHQAPGADGGLGFLDVARTNLFSASVAESVTSCVTAPVVAGGTRLLEMTIPLSPAWDPEDLNIPAEEAATPTSEGLDKETVYFARYCTEGSEFADHAATGRLWVANTDGRYDGTPYLMTRTNLAEIIGGDEPAWPVMAHKPRPCLTYLNSLTAIETPGIGGEVYGEYSLDGGETWLPLPGFSVLHDYVGLRITQANLADIFPPDAEDPVEDNFFAALAAVDPSGVMVQLTATIAAPDRNVAEVFRRHAAGTAFATQGWVDVQSLAQVRVVVPGSRFAEGGYLADVVTQDEAAVEIAAKAVAAQDLAEDRLIEAACTIEWPDEPIYLGDRISGIAGIDVGFGVNAGVAMRYPRVIGRVLNLDENTWSMTLHLDTDRKTGIRRERREP
jgi:hypothetical protein